MNQMSKHVPRKKDHQQDNRPFRRSNLPLLCGDGKRPRRCHADADTAADPQLMAIYMWALTR